MEELRERITPSLTTHRQRKHASQHKSFEKIAFLIPSLYLWLIITNQKADPGPRSLDRAETLLLLFRTTLLLHRQIIYLRPLNPDLTARNHISDPSTDS